MASSCMNHQYWQVDCFACDEALNLALFGPFTAQTANLLQTETPQVLQFQLEVSPPTPTTESSSMAIDPALASLADSQFDSNMGPVHFGGDDSLNDFTFGGLGLTSDFAAMPSRTPAKVVTVSEQRSPYAKYLRQRIGQQKLHPRHTQLAFSQRCPMPLKFPVSNFNFYSEILALDEAEVKRDPIVRGILNEERQRRVGKAVEEANNEFWRKRKQTSSHSNPTAPPKRAKAKATGQASAPRNNMDAYGRAMGPARNQPLRSVPQGFFQPPRSGPPKPQAPTDAVARERARLGQTSWEFNAAKFDQSRPRQTEKPKAKPKARAAAPTEAVARERARLNKTSWVQVGFNADQFDIQAGPLDQSPQRGDTTCLPLRLSTQLVAPVDLMLQPAPQAPAPTPKQKETSKVEPAPQPQPQEAPTAMDLVLSSPTSTLTILSRSPSPTIPFHLPLEEISSDPDSPPQPFKRGSSIGSDPFEDAEKFDDFWQQAATRPKKAFSSPSLSPKSFPKPKSPKRQPARRRRGSAPAPARRSTRERTPTRKKREASEESTPQSKRLRRTKARFGMFFDAEDQEAEDEASEFEG